MKHLPNRQAKIRKQNDDLNLTLKTMRKFMVEGSEKPYVISLAGRITNEFGVRPAFYSDPISYDIDRMRALYTWCRENISYVHDGYTPEIGQREVIKDVENTLRDGAGDCDCITCVIGALILCTFDGCMYKNVRYSPVEVWLWGYNGIPAHVFPVGVLANGDKVVMDAAAMPGQSFGDLPGNAGTVGTFWPTILFGPTLDMGIRG